MAGMLQAAEAAAAEAATEAPQRLIAESYAPPDPGPYPQDKPPENSVRFTPVQVRMALLTLLCCSRCQSCASAVAEACSKEDGP
jgi:hypothetical protein